MKVAAVIIGVFYTLFCEALAFMMVGAGHGWLTPFFWGSLGLIVFPLCAYAGLSAQDDGRLEKASLGLAIVAAVGADLILVERSFDEGLQYMSRAGPIAFLWIGLWLAGQTPLVYAIARRVLRGATLREA